MNGPRYEHEPAYVNPWAVLLFTVMAGVFFLCLILAASSMKPENAPELVPLSITDLATCRNATLFPVFDMKTKQIQCEPLEVVSKLPKVKRI